MWLYLCFYDGLCEHRDHIYLKHIAYGDIYSVQFLKYLILKVQSINYRDWELNQRICETLYLRPATLSFGLHFIKYVDFHVAEENHQDKKYIWLKSTQSMMYCLVNWAVWIDNLIMVIYLDCETCTTYLFNPFTPGNTLPSGRRFKLLHISTSFRICWKS